MIRNTIIVPRVLMMATSCDWDIDWGGQSAGEDTARGDTVVYNRFPRFVGSPKMTLPRDVIGHWRALRWQMQGRVHAWSIPMLDEVSYAWSRSTWQADWQAYVADQYIEPRPQVSIVGAFPAGSSSIVVDETAADEPLRIGAIYSVADWPFVVTGRSGSGAAVTLQVQRLAQAVSDGDLVDLYARGLFVSTSDTMGNPAYTRARQTAVDLSFVEWITRV